MNSFTENKTFEVFDGFISNLIQYLSSNLKNNRLDVALNQLYYANETIAIAASYLDENYNFDNRAKLWITITNEASNFIKKVPFTLLNNQFYVELTNIPSGEYTYAVSVENQKVSALGNFKIVPFEVEQQFTNSNFTKLAKLSSNTNGTIYFNGDNTLISDLKLDERFKSIQKINVTKTPLINFKWLLGLIILSLSVEWFLRKYFGKI